MNEYLLSIIGVVLLSALITAIVPEGKTAPVIKAVSRLVCVLAILSPVLRFFQEKTALENAEDLPTFFSQSVIDEQDAFIKYYSEMRAQATERALEKELNDKFDVQAKVSLFWEIPIEYLGEYSAFDGIQITKIHIKFEENAMGGDNEGMMEYLRKNYCSEVQIE